ncbi:MAG: hypothetical protein O2788_02225, partial [Chloroflexi bacterium]|nr:hypothetical protein [Chloroflexota bacterium]
MKSEKHVPYSTPSNIDLHVPDIYAWPLVGAILGRMYDFNMAGRPAKQHFMRRALQDTVTVLQSVWFWVGET